MRLKNYILLSIFYIITILVVIYFCVIYQNSSKNVSDSDISNYVVDVSSRDYGDLYNNINNYNVENSQFIIYVASYKYTDLSSFESIFQDVINDMNLKSKILYINVDDLKSFGYINKFLNDFGYSESVKVSSLPIFIVVNNNEVIDLKSVIDLNKDDIESIVRKIYD